MLAAIDGHTRLVGVLGWPVEHTMSPAMHNAAFEAMGINWRYLPLAVHPDRVGEAVCGLRALGFAGCNVTVPHKQSVMGHLDLITDQARSIGAVNTILVQPDGRTMGHNTDAEGFLRALAEAGFVPDGRRAVVVGAGGAARAVVFALASVGTVVAVLNRTPSRAESLVTDLAPQFPSVSLRALSLTPSILQEEVGSADLLVNATSLGMWPRVERSPWPDEFSMPASLTVFDLVYNPPETKLMHQASAARARPIGGLQMLVYQGVAAWELWTELGAPVEVMTAAAKVSLARPT